MLRFFVYMMMIMLLLSIASIVDSAECGCSEESEVLEMQVHSELQDLGPDVAALIERLAAGHIEGRAIPGNAGAMVEKIAAELRKLTTRLEKNGIGPENRITKKIKRVAALLDNASLFVSGKVNLPPPRVWPTTADWGVDAHGRTPPPADNCSNAFPLSYGSANGMTIEATNDGSASCGASMLSPDVWFQFTADETREISVNTLGSDFDTVLSVHSACPGTMANQLSCNDDWLGLQSAVSFDAVAGETYLIRVAGSAGATGNYTVELGDGGGVRGRASYNSGGSSIPNLDIRIYGSSGYLRGMGETDSSGMYTVESFTAGPVFARTDADYTSALLDEIYRDIQCDSQSCDVTSGTPIPITYGSVTGGIDFDLDIGGRISGTVRDQIDGSEISGAKIKFYNAGGQYVGYVTTGCSNGYYNINDLEPGTYYAIAGKEGEYADELFYGHYCAVGCDPTDGTEITVAINNPATGVNFTLTTLGALSGRVVESATAEGIYGVAVRIYDESGSFITSGSTDADGYYEIGGIPSGNYYVRAVDYDYIDQLYPDINCEDWSCSISQGDRVLITNGSVTSGINFALDMLGVIRGQVIDEATGLGVGSLRVELWSNGGEYLKYDYVGSDGYFEISNVEAGTYFLATDDSNSYYNELYDNIPCGNGPPDDCNVVTGLAVEAIFNNPTEGVDFALARRPSITGTLTDERDDSPIAGVWVYAYDAERFLDADTTDASGFFQLERLLQGEIYVVTQNAATAGFVDELFDDIPCPGGEGVGCDRFQGTPIVVPHTGTVAGVDISLTPMATISGSVVARATSSPLSGVSIEIRDAQGRIAGTAVTDSTGAYAVNGLIGGTYFASSTGAGVYLDQLFDDIPCPGGAPDGCAPLTGTAIEVANAAEHSGINFALDRGGEIHGTVVEEETGAPIYTATVYARDIHETFVASDSTDSSGVFVLEGLPPGEYYVSSAESGYRGELYSEIPCPSGSPAYCDFSLGTPVAVDLGAPATGIDFTLGQGSVVMGMVTDKFSGLPIEGASVEIKFYDETGAIVRSVYPSVSSYSVTLDSGTYFAAVTRVVGYEEQLFREIPIDSAAFDPTAGEAVVVENGVTVRHVDFPLVPTGAIAGTITDAVTGAGFGNNKVEVFEVNGTLVESKNVDAHGNYRIDDLLPGAYFVATANSYPAHVDQLYEGIPCQQGASASCDPTTGTPVLVTSGVTNTIDFALAPTAAIAGKVTSQLDGHPLSSTYVRVWDESGAIVETSYTNSAGVYLINGLGTGSYFVSTNRPGGDHIDELHDGISCPGGVPAGCELSDGALVSVVTGTPPSVVDFVLDQWGVISGLVTDDESGMASTYIDVTVYSVPDYQQVASTYTNYNDGAYRITGLLPGDYVVFVDDNDFIDELYDDIPCEGINCDLASGTPVPAAINSETSDIDFALTRVRGEISGRVIDASTGQPLGNVRVRGYNVNGAEIYSDNTDSNGVYNLYWIPPGDHFVIANASDSRYLDELYDDIPCHNAPYGCNPTKGTPIAVDNDHVDGIDFELELLSEVTGVRGAVTDALTGLPVAGAYVDIWRSVSGTHYKTVITAIDGSFFSELYGGTFFLSTDTNQAYEEEIYDDVLCPGGPAFQGFCDAFAGTPVEIAAGQMSTGIDFVLMPRIDFIFNDGFESGDSSNWNGTAR